MKTIGVGLGVTVICSLVCFPITTIADNQFLNCQQAWEQSQAKDTCSAIGSRIYIPIAAEAGFRTCEINVRCKQNSGYLKPQKVKFDISEVPELKNCDGNLRVGNC